MTIKKYKIKNTNLWHNGSVEKIGNIIELDDKAAEKLQDVLTLVKETPSNNKPQNKNVGKGDGKEESKGEGKKETKKVNEPENDGGEKDGE